MKRFLMILSVTIILIIPSIAAAEKTVTLDVQNMTCALCPLTVRKALEAVDGVSEVKVSNDDKTVVVIFDEAKTDIAVLTAATTNAGYPSSPAKETAYK